MPIVINKSKKKKKKKKNDCKPNPDSKVLKKIKKLMEGKK